MKRESLVNLSVLLVSFLLCALLLEVVSRLFFEAPPSVVIDNLSDPDAASRPMQERENVTLKDGQIFSKGVRIEVGDMLPSEHYAERMKSVPPLWDKAFEVNASGDPAVRASCVEFVLAGLYAGDAISRSTRHGRIEYEF